METDDCGFSYPQVDDERCVRCGLCQKLCPENRELGGAGSVVRCFYAVSADSEDVRNSSSGGIFPAMAKIFLEQNGAVAGAAFDDDFNVVLKIIENIRELPQLMGAKYVQAAVPQGFYQAAEQILAADRPLLFTGTPCHIAAFRSFLNGRVYRKLICAEVICHGVPSPAVWQSYLDTVKNKLSALPERVNFRDKSSGWHDYRLVVSSGDKFFSESHHKSPYSRLFVKNVSLRKSCFDCQFKSGSSGADLSMGDFWKLRKIMPELDNHTGASMVIVLTPAGEELLKKLKLSELREFSSDVIEKSNRAFYVSAVNSEPRSVFFAEFCKHGCRWFDVSEFIEKKTFLRKLKSFLLRVFSLKKFRF